ncbi:MAG: beta-ketoacyl-[acyl-carrier-protein] synthase family protein [Planctomycetota bacterium]
MRERILVTGLGAVSPLGWGVMPLWEGLVAGRSGLGPVRRFDASAFRSAGGGEVPQGEGEGPTPARTLAEGYLLEAVREALAGSGAPREGTALVVGTNFGGMSAAERALAGGGEPDLAGYEFREQAARCARELGLSGVTVALSLSCASGTAALVVARDLIRSGRAERAVAAGYDELSRYAFGGLAALRAMTTTALRPFDRRRDGTLFSEGAGAIVIESERAAAERGRGALAEVLGGALTNDGYHMTAPEKEARGIQALIRGALADAGTDAGRVDHVNLHGTGTKYNDAIETKALKGVFGERATRIPVTANKGTLGHAMGAAGALETVATVLSMRHGLVPPTMGHEEPDPECDLDVVTGGAREVRVGVALKTSYGIGGANAAVVLGAA